MKKTINGAIFAKKYDWEDSYRYTFYECKEEDLNAYSEQGLIFIKLHEIVFEELKENVIYAKHLESLNMKKAKIIADHYVNIQKVEEEIKELLFIENKE